MATISAESVKNLRELTGAGIMDCKRVLEETDGDVEKAVAAPARAGPRRRCQEGRPRGPRGAHLAATSTPAAGSASSSRSTARRTSSPGRTSSSSSSAISRSRSPGSPRCTSMPTRSPPPTLEAKKAELAADPTAASKPAEIREKIVDGQLKKWFKEVCLLDQPFRDEERSVRDLVTDRIATIGENIRVRRFVRYALGEDL